MARSERRQRGERLTLARGRHDAARDGEDHDGRTRVAKTSPSGRLDLSTRVDSVREVRWSNDEPDGGGSRMRQMVVSAALGAGIAFATLSTSQATMLQFPLRAAGETNIQLAQAGHRFETPRSQGLSLDWCSSYAQGCGWAAANLFCRQKGYARATSWNVYYPGETFVPLGSRHFCRGPQCRALRDVDCTS